MTRFTNRALVIGSSAALTLGLGMTGFVPAAFATETPTPEVPSQESPAELTPVTDSAPSDADAQNQPAPDPAANDPAASVKLATPVKAPPAPAEPADPAVPSGSNFAHPEEVKTVEDSEIHRTWWLINPIDSMKGDALVKRTADEEYDTQHNDTFKVNPGDTLDIKSNLDVSVGFNEMKEMQEKAIEAMKKSSLISRIGKATADNLIYDEAESVIETFISIPDYLEIPDDPESYTLETHNGDNPLYRIASVMRSTKRLAIKLTLNESYEKGNYKRGSYPRLRDSFAAYVNKPLSLVISGVKVKDNIPPEGARAKLKFKTLGYLRLKSFGSGAKWESYALSNFSELYRHWSDVQDPEGLDSEPIYYHVVSLTMDIKPKPTPADPVVPTPNQPVIPDTPSVVPGPVPGGTVVPPSEPVPPVAGVTTTPAAPEPPVAGVTTTPTAPEPPVAGVFTPAAPRIPVAQGPDKALAATGSSAETLAGGAMIVFLAGGAMMVASRRRARR